MGIVVLNAYENNLKNFSVDIPTGKMTALTGVSGSGKSSLLKNVLAASGARKYTCTQSKTIRSALMLSNYVKVDEVVNLPQTVFIDAKNAVTTPNSTVSTVSGVHELLRNLFLDLGECYCPFCGKRINDTIKLPKSFVVDIVCDERYDIFLTQIADYGKIVNELFFDKNQNVLPKRGKSARFAEVHFEIENCSEKQIAEINKVFNCIVYVDRYERYDPIKKVLCENCGRAVPRLTRGRMSFFTPFDEGGGMCRRCNGSGQIVGTETKTLILDDNKTFLGGAICFVNDKGIKYTQVNVSIIKAFARRENIDLKKKVKDLSSTELEKLMEGDVIPLSIAVGHGKKISVIYRGVIGELKESFLKGKGVVQLARFFKKQCCSFCHGTRLDEELKGLRLYGKPLETFLRMTFSELREWCEVVQPQIDYKARPYLERLLHKVDNFCRISCGHLSLDRASNTLSGGELQRIRVCSLLNASVNGLCYLLDEPSSGLHEQDIESLGALLRDICDKGNTIVMVEHNRKMLSFCDWIVEIGPGGGENGGTLVFSDNIDNIANYESPTARLLSGKLKPIQKNVHAKIEDFLLFEHLEDNNLKDVTVSIPYGVFSTVCGISGSGKSTLLRNVLLERIGKNVKKYNFADIVYLSQNSVAIPYTSTVATQVDCFNVIVSSFSKSSQIPQEYFKPNSSKGKCPICAGRGVLVSPENELVGICHNCKGQRFDADVLAATLKHHHFGELMMLPLSEIGKFVEDESINSFSKMASLLGIGYLTLSRQISTLSKGEYQRLKIANAIAQNVKNTLFLLDEPSKGLHATDATNLITAIHELTAMGNTVVAVEHNPIVIFQSDYIIEFGGTGKSGGYLLYSGISAGIVDKDTPTGYAIKETMTVKPHQQSKFNMDCKYEIGGQPYIYAQNSVHDVTSLRSQFEDIESMTLSDLLAATIPGNVFYSRTKYFEERIISSPVFRSIDFATKKRYSFSIYDVLGLRESYTKDVIRRNPGKADLLRFVFDDNSLTGKCNFCKGRGRTEVVDEDLFLDGHYLSKEAQQFLKKSLMFTETLKELNNKLGISLLDEFGEKNKLARQILFYGYDACIQDRLCECEWPGLINFFLRNHAHYPNDLGDVFFASRHNARCPVCGGRMFQSEYNQIASTEPLKYQDLMRKPIEWVMDKLDDNRMEQRYSCLKQHLKIAIDLGIGGLCAGEWMSGLSEVQTGLVCLAAMMNYGIWGSAVAVRHLEILQPIQKKNVMEAINDLAKTNTVFIC